MSHDAPHTGHGEHERTDVTVRPLVLAGVGLTIALMITAVAMLGMYDFFATRFARLSPRQNPLAAAEGPRLPPVPRLQVHPIKDLRELRASEAEVLEHYGWVDKQAGVVRIPIDRAIQLLAQRQGAKAATP
ncbi:MAG: hypothetical protein ACRERC_24660 [Candidatus Binatia bacterium]